MKKLLSIVLAVAMVIGCVAVTGIFASAETSNVTSSGNVVENGDFEALEVGATAFGRLTVAVEGNSKVGTYSPTATYDAFSTSLKDKIVEFSERIGTTKSFTIKLRMDVKATALRGDQQIKVSVRNFINDKQKIWANVVTANAWNTIKAEYVITPAEIATLGDSNFGIDGVQPGATIYVDNIYAEFTYTDYLTGDNVLPTEVSTFDGLADGTAVDLVNNAGAVVATEGTEKVATFVPTGSYISPYWELAPYLKTMANQLGEYESFKVKVSMDFKTSNKTRQYVGSLIMRTCAGRVSEPVADSNNNVKLVNQAGEKNIWYTVSAVFELTPADIAALAGGGYNLCLDGVTENATYTVDNISLCYYIENDLTISAAAGDAVTINGVAGATAKIQKGATAEISVILADGTKQFKGLSDGTNEYLAVEGVVSYTMPGKAVTLSVLTEDARSYIDGKNTLPESITDLSDATVGAITDAYGKLSFGGCTDAAIVEKDGEKVFTYKPSYAWCGPSVSIAPYVITMASQLDLKAGESFDVEISFALMLDGTGEVSNAGIAGFLFRDLRGNVSCLDDITNAGAANSYMGLGHCGTSKGTWNKVTKIVTFTYEDIQGMIAEGAEYNLTFDQSVKNGTYFLKDLNVRYYVEPQETPEQGGSKPEGTGDVLPVALIATVALASVALVVVSKKRKED